MRFHTPSDTLFDKSLSRLPSSMQNIFHRLALHIRVIDPRQSGDTDGGAALKRTNVPNQKTLIRFSTSNYHGGHHLMSH